MAGERKAPSLAGRLAAAIALTIVVKGSGARSLDRALAHGLADSSATPPLTTGSAR